MLMKGGGNRSHGFTIVEVMIVLAVTGFMLLGALEFVGGRQNTAEFNLGINDIFGQIQQQINNTADGYYTAVTGPYSCSVATPTSVPTLSSHAGGGRGTNAGCVDLGTALHFYEGGTSVGQYSIWPVIGRQCSSSVTTSPCPGLQNVADALPVAGMPGIANGGGIYTYSDNNFPKLGQDTPLENGINVVAMCFDNTGCNSRSPGSQITCTVAFISNPSTTAVDAGGLLTGGTRLDLYAIADTGGHCQTDTIPTASIPGNTKGVQDLDDTLQGLASLPAAGQNPQQSIEICFASGTTKQSGLVTMTSGINNNPGLANEYSGQGISTTLTEFEDTSC